jgi:hypothetical protein
VITSYKEEGHYYNLFTEQFVITSYTEEGLYYHLFTGQSVITSYREEGLDSKTLLLYMMLSRTASLSK